MKDCSHQIEKIHRSTFQQIADISIVFLRRIWRQSVKKQIWQKYSLFMQSKCFYKISSFNEEQKYVQLKTKTAQAKHFKINVKLWAYANWHTNMIFHYGKSLNSYYFLKKFGTQLQKQFIFMGKKTHQLRKNINIFALYCMNKPYFCRIIFLTDWRHEGLKNTINRLLFYAEHYPWIFGKYHNFYIFELMIHLLTEEDFFNIHADTLLNTTPGVWIV